MKPKVAVVDYGMGNLYSVCNSFKSIGIRADIIGSPKNLSAYDKLILPGVGAFGDAMKELKKRGFVAPIKDFVHKGKPFLGICLGMQLLFDKSDESGGGAGLGLIPGAVKKFSSKLKCPHMGWNQIDMKKSGRMLFRGLKSSIYTYFCHSYYVRPKDRSLVIGETQYGVKFASIVKLGNIYGMQFHPEKSQEAGLKLLENFIRFC
jgi:glutamine amidotransferase